MSLDRGRRTESLRECRKSAQEGQESNLQVLGKCNKVQLAAAPLQHITIKLGIGTAWNTKSASLYLHILIGANAPGSLRPPAGPRSLAACIADSLAFVSVGIFFPFFYLSVVFVRPVFV